MTSMKNFLRCLIVVPFYLLQPSIVHSAESEFDFEEALRSPPAESEVISILPKDFGAPVHIGDESAVESPSVPPAARAPEKKVGTMVLPKLMTPKFYKTADVCADARAHDPRKKIALVLLKSHLCDVAPNGYCLDATRVLSSPAMVFARKYFALYHARLTQLRVDQDHNFVADLLKGASKIAQEWEFKKEIPQYTFLNLKTCKIISDATTKVPYEVIRTAYARRQEESFSFYKTMRNHALASKTVQTILNRHVPKEHQVMSEVVVKAEWRRAQRYFQKVRLPTRTETQAAIAQQNPARIYKIQMSFMYVPKKDFDQGNIDYFSKSDERRELDVKLFHIDLPISSKSYQWLGNVDQFMLGTH